MTLPLSGLQPITESPLPSPSTVDHLQQQDTPAMSPAMSNTARFAAEATSIETSAASSRSGRTRGTTDGFDVNAAYVKALRDEQVSTSLGMVWIMADRDGTGATSARSYPGPHTTPRKLDR